MNKRNKYIASFFAFLLAMALLFLPLTYYGFIDYVIENTVININLNRDTLETDKAAIAIYSGAELNFFPNWALNVLVLLGFLSLYASIAILFIGKKILSKEYWITFTMIK